MSAAEGADFLADNLLSPRTITDDDINRFLSESERIDWPLTRDEGRLILFALLTIRDDTSRRPDPSSPVHFGPLLVEPDALDMLIEYACEYWGECDDPEPMEPCS